MANAYIQGTKPNNYGECMSTIVGMLTSAGWTVKASGSTGSFSSSGSVFGTTGSNSSISFSAATTTVNWLNHPLVVGQAVTFSNSGGALPAAINNTTTYYVTSIATSTFTISATLGGQTNITFATAGSGTHTISYTITWARPHAWIRLADPSDLREVVFQHDNAGGCRIKYSPSSKFTGGAISETVTPYAVDEKFVRGGGLDNFPFYLGTANGTLFQQACTVGGAVFNGAAMGTAPYGFWVAWTLRGTQVRLGGLMMDPVLGQSEDPDPVVWHVGGGIGTSASQNEAFYLSVNTQSVLASDGGSDSVWWATSRFPGGPSAALASSVGVYGVGNLSGEWFYYYPAGYVCGNGASTIALITGHYGNAASQVTTGSNINQYILGPNPFNGKQDSLPVLWTRVNHSISVGSSNRNSTGTMKGWSTLCRWTGTNRQTFSDTMDSKNWICVGPFWLPWNGTTPINS